MDYWPYLGRTIDLFVSFVLIALSVLVTASFFPGVRLIGAVVIGCSGVWCLGNIVCMMEMILRHERAT